MKILNSKRIYNEYVSAAEYIKKEHFFYASSFNIIQCEIYILKRQRRSKIGLNILTIVFK